MVDKNEMYHMVKEFQKAFGHPWSDKPRMLTEEEVAGRYKWTLEELNELVEAKTIFDQADALTDALYFILGSFAMMGIEPFNLLEIVHKANMAKLWEDGKPRYKEDGKVKKPEGWVAPEPLLEKEIQRQLENN